MAVIQQLIFFALLGTAIYLFSKSVKRIYGNIALGKPFGAIDNKSERLKQMLLIALGQKKMFKKPLPAILHLAVYLGFLIVNIELLEIVLDGLLGTHRVFAPILGSLYAPVINFFEFFAVAVLLSCVIFLIRRNIIKVERLNKEEIKGWAKLDANLILVLEIVLMVFLLSMNATDTVIQRANGIHQSFLFSDLLVPVFSNLEGASIVVAERIFWWMHIIGIFCFANYVPYSKHLHIFLAFPNTYLSNLNPKGKMANMPEVTKEVQIMLGLAQPDAASNNGPIGRFGAKDVTDLHQKNLLDAYSCTECGRCTASCPANITGKLLSPRKIMMDTRDRLEEVGKNILQHGPEYSDGKSLLGDYIKEEELYACTTCNACVEACPVNIDPLSIIVQLRRYKVMEEASGPSEWNGMYSNIETSFSPWKFPPTDRFKWSNSI